MACEGVRLMANEKRLIDANAEIKKLKDGYCLNCADYYEILCKTCDIREAIRIMDDAPTVDSVEVVHGRYEMGIDEGDYEYGTCSVCGYNEYNAFGCCLPHNYCPNCGAKMDGDKDSNLLFADMEEIIDA